MKGEISDKWDAMEILSQVTDAHKGDPGVMHYAFFEEQSKCTRRSRLSR